MDESLMSMNKTRDLLRRYKSLLEKDGRKRHADPLLTGFGSEVA